jgi:hypothetical protein
VNLTIRAVGGGVRGTFGPIEGITDVIGTGVVMPVGVMFGPGVATVSGGVTSATTGAGVAIEVTGGAGVAAGGASVVIEVTGGAGVAAGGAGVVIEVTGSAGVAAGDAGAVVEVTVRAGGADGDHKRNFDATATTTTTAQITAPRPASNFHSFHVGIVGGAVNFRLWRVTPAPALSRSSSRICRACSSDCRALEKFPSQIAFVPS